MTERDWELYRLSVVLQLPEGPYKDAIVAGIHHKLQLMDRQELTQTNRSAAFPRQRSDEAAKSPALARR